MVYVAVSSLHPYHTACHRIFGQLAGDIFRKRKTSCSVPCKLPYRHTAGDFLVCFQRRKCIASKLWHRPHFTGKLHLSPCFFLSAHFRFFFGCQFRKRPAPEIQVVFQKGSGLFRRHRKFHHIPVVHTAPAPNAVAPYGNLTVLPAGIILPPTFRRCQDRTEFFRDTEPKEQPSGQSLRVIHSSASLHILHDSLNTRLFSTSSSKVTGRKPLMSTPALSTRSRAAMREK